MWNLKCHAPLFFFYHALWHLGIVCSYLLVSYELWAMSRKIMFPMIYLSKSDRATMLLYYFCRLHLNGVTTNDHACYSPFSSICSRIRLRRSERHNQVAARQMWSPPSLPVCSHYMHNKLSSKSIVKAHLVLIQLEPFFLSICSTHPDLLFKYIYLIFSLQTASNWFLLFILTQ